MNVNHKNQNINASTTQIFKGETRPMLTKDEKMQKLISKGVEFLCNIAEREVPQNGKFARVYITLDIPDTNNQAIVHIAHDENQPDKQRRAVVSVHHKNADRLISQELFKGTKSEILDFLNNPLNNQEIIDEINTLSDATDEFYSSSGF